MKIAFACLADHASADAMGKLSVNGVFDVIRAASFPVRHRSMYLLCRVRLEYSDANKKLPIAVRLLDEDGVKGAEITGLIESQGVVPPGRFATHNLILHLQDLVFPKAGRYRIEISGDEGEPTTVDLMLDQQ